MASAHFTISVATAAAALLTGHVSLLTLCLSSIHMWGHHTLTCRIGCKRLLSISKALIRRSLPLPSHHRLLIPLEKNGVSFIISILHFNGNLFQIGFLGEIKGANPLFKHLLINGVECLNQLRCTSLQHSFVIGSL